MPNAQTFAHRLAEVDALTRHWRLGPAYRAALKLKQDFPDEPQAHTLFHLLVCLTDNQAGVGGGMFYVSPRLVSEAVQGVPGFENSMAHGDMLRDRLLGLVRFRDARNDCLELAATLPAQIANLHSGDGNRLACLEDARARLIAARGDLLEACDLHKLAHQEWTALPDGQADPNWMHFNLVHWLRTSIELWGRTSPHTRQVLDLLAAETQPAPGGHGDRQIRVITMPLVGLAVYRWLETHRMSRP
ncbi:MAG TPA: hypothetical protein VJM46_04810 [Candidatus Saccharimonadales bacterium]|nr:hypothetical protein [Candidatus Saccharimonadales bacterium]